jgi:hypothetical protein
MDRVWSWRALGNCTSTTAGMIKCACRCSRPNDTCCKLLALLVSAVLSHTGCSAQPACAPDGTCVRRRGRFQHSASRSAAHYPLRRRNYFAGAQNSAGGLGSTADSSRTAWLQCCVLVAFPHMHAKDHMLSEAMDVVAECRSLVDTRLRSIDPAAGFRRSFASPPLYPWHHCPVVTESLTVQLNYLTPSIGRVRQLIRCKLLTP